MSYEITMLEGYGTPTALTRSTSKQKESQMKLGTAAKKCKGRKAGAFRACVKRVMKGGPVGAKRKKHRRSRR